MQVNKRHYTKKDNVPGTSKIVVGRQCKVCKKQSTSQWRRGPDGSSKLHIQSEHGHGVKLTFSLLF